MSYDRKCYDLAETFLEDDLIGINHKARCHELAQLIQTTIEDWMSFNRPDLGTAPIPSQHSGGPA